MNRNGLTLLILAAPASIALGHGPGDEAKVNETALLAQTMQRAEEAEAAASEESLARGPDRAQVIPPVTDERPLEVAEEAEAPAGPLSFYGGISVVSEYISRGLGFSDEVSYQPWFEAYVALPSAGDGPMTSWSWFAGTWNSLQDGPPGYGQPRDDDLANWYENDLYTGLTATFYERWSTSFAYYYYNSPSDSFDSYHELEWKLTFDDEGLWDDAVPLEGFALQPSLRVTQEINRPNTADGLYIQPSLTPSFIVRVFDQPMRVAVPIVLGFGEDFYTDVEGHDETYGYLKTGVNVSLPLRALPEGAGTLTLTGGVDVWLSSDEINSGFGDEEIVGRIGLNWGF